MSSPRPPPPPPLPFTAPAPPMSRAENPKSVSVVPTAAEGGVEAELLPLPLLAATKEGLLWRLLLRLLPMVPTDTGR